MLSSDSEKMLTLKSCAAGSEMLLAIWREFEAGKMAHAYLFCGESGVGKRTFARVLAKALLCSGEGDRPCGQCRSCKRFEAGTHSNAYFPKPQPKKVSIGVDDLRTMMGELGRASLEGGKRVIVINQAEKMTPQAQNSLLKTLEEAAEGTFFFLVTDTERAILPTIRSRCRMVRMPQWPDERIYKALMEKGIPALRAKELTGLCEGSLGKALKMQEDDGYWADRETVQQSFLQVKRTADIPAASLLLKNKKDQAEDLLSILEREIRRLIEMKEENKAEDTSFFPAHWQGADVKSLMRIQDAVMRCKRYKLSNVGWTANAENLMQSIAEEATKWQQ